MAVGKFDVIEQYLDNNGEELAGGLIYTYAAGTTTPLATYTDATGGTPNANPVVLDSAGRASVWFTKGVSYKVVIKTAAGVTLKTEDGLSLFDDAAALSGLDYVVSFDYFGDEGPGASQYFGGHVFTEDVTFPANFVGGAYGKIDTGNNPTAQYVITLAKNGTTCGTVTIATDGSFTFASSGGATVAFLKGQRITGTGQLAGDATLNKFGFSLEGPIQ
jgi:hypothetical protein